MTVLISKEVAIEAVKTALLSWSSMPQWRDDKIIDVLAELPSAQPEIIRCKDCIYFDKGYDEETADWCHAWAETTSEDGYCHNAERGEEQE